MTSASQAAEIFTSLHVLRNRIEDRLADVGQYRALRTIERTISELAEFEDIARSLADIRTNIHGRLNDVREYRALCALQNATIEISSVVALIEEGADFSTVQETAAVEQDGRTTEAVQSPDTSDESPVDFKGYEVEMEQALRGDSPVGKPLEKADAGPIAPATASSDAGWHLDTGDDDADAYRRFAEPVASERPSNPEGSEKNIMSRALDMTKDESQAETLTMSDTQAAEGSDKPEEPKADGASEAESRAA